MKTAIKHGGTSTNAMVDSSSKRKSVRFSRYSHSRVFRSPYEDISMKSYTKRDYKRFDCVRSRDIVKCSRMLAIKIGSGHEITTEDLIYCTGLETMLSPDLPRRSKKVSCLDLSYALLVYGFSTSTLFLLIEREGQGCERDAYGYSSI
jgi:hypothetical protein